MNSPFVNNNPAIMIMLQTYDLLWLSSHIRVPTCTRICRIVWCVWEGCFCFYSVVHLAHKTIIRHHTSQHIQQHRNHSTHVNCLHFFALYAFCEYSYYVRAGGVEFRCCMKNVIKLEIHLLICVCLYLYHSIFLVNS